MSVPKGNQTFLRKYNRRLLVNLLETEGPLSRSELARRTGLSPSVLTRRVQSLLREGVVREAGKAASSGGRRPTLLSFNPDYAGAIGVKIERTRLLAARVDLGGRITARDAAQLDGPPDVSATVAGIRAAVDRLATGRVLGVGVCVSGHVDAKRRIDLYSPILGWRDIPLAELLERAIDLPIHVENDVNALSLAEHAYGAGRRFAHFVCLTVGEGIGAGIVLNGTLYRGAFGAAGEIGHTTFDPSGPACRCGEPGCLEVYASDRFLEAEATRLGYRGIPDLMRAAREADGEAHEVFVRMGRTLGLGAKNVVNLLNPEAIVLGGERMDASDLFLPAFQETVRRHAFPQAATHLEIIPSELGPDGFLIGGARLATRSAFSVPSAGGQP